MGQGRKRAARGMIGRFLWKSSDWLGCAGKTSAKSSVLFVALILRCFRSSNDREPSDELFLSLIRLQQLVLEEEYRIKMSFCLFLGLVCRRSIG